MAFADKVISRVFLREKGFSRVAIEQLDSFFSVLEALNLTFNFECSSRQRFIWLLPYILFCFETCYLHEVDPYDGRGSLAFLEEIIGSSCMPTLYGTLSFLFFPLTIHYLTIWSPSFTFFFSIMHETGCN